jgi:hypothetical protein
MNMPGSYLDQPGNQKAFHVLLSLSLPPIKGLDPVMDPPIFGMRGHHVSFDISLEDSEDFEVALHSRGMVMRFLF